MISGLYEDEHHHVYLVVVVMCERFWDKFTFDRSQTGLNDERFHDAECCVRSPLEGFITDPGIKSQDELKYILKKLAYCCIQVNRGKQCRFKVAG